MDITHRISLDLQQNGARQVMYAKQGDSLTRIARLLLYDGGTEFTVPEGTILLIAFAKPDGKGGLYDKMPDDSDACTVSGNVVTAKLHPQMFSTAGTVACELRLLTASGAQLSTFSWFISVQASATDGIVSENYFRFATVDGLQEQIGDLDDLTTEAKDSLVAAINEVLKKCGVTSVAGKTGEVKLEAGDVSAALDITEEDGTKIETVAQALAYLYLLAKNGGTAYPIAENEDQAAVMRQIAQLTVELKQGTETGVGNVGVPIINTEDSQDGVSVARIVRSDAEKDAAAGDVNVPSEGRVSEMIDDAIGTSEASDDHVKELVAENAVTSLSIGRDANGGYTAKWTQGGTENSADIYGGVGLARVTEILSFNSDTKLPRLHKSKIDGSHEYPVMIGDLIVYTGEDYVGQVWSEAASADVDVTVARKNEVFRVRAVSESGTDDEYYNVERTGLVLQESGFIDRKTKWLAWLLEEDGQTSDADVTIDEIYRFFKQLPAGLHYVNNESCWGEFWAIVTSPEELIIFQPPYMYFVTGSGVLKLSEDGTIQKYIDGDGYGAFENAVMARTSEASADLFSIPPTPTAADAGKVLMVSSDGQAVWAAVENAEKVAV